jgi:hypothetical protein
MQKQFIDAQEFEFLTWLRGLSPQCQDNIYEGVVTATLPQAMASVACEQPHRFFKVPATVGFKYDSFLVGQSDFVHYVVSTSDKHV